MGRPTNFSIGMPVPPVELALSTVTPSYKAVKLGLAREREHNVSAAPSGHAACYYYYYWTKPDDIREHISVLIGILLTQHRINVAP